MAEYLSPEVYIEEIPSGLKPIQGVGTSTAAFVGLCQRGPFGQAVPITSFAQFVSTFGSYVDGAYLAFAVRSFFSEGGTSCYVVRTCHYAPSATPPNDIVPTATTASMTLSNATPLAVLSLTADSAGAWGDDLSVTVRLLTPADRFLVELRYAGTLVETFGNLSMDPTSLDYAVTRINEGTASSRYVIAADLVPAASALTPAARRPVATTSPAFLAGGDDGLTNIDAIDFYGQEELGNGFYAFDKVFGINLLAVPEAVDRAVHVKGNGYCERRKDCFYIADSQSTINAADDVVNYKLAQGDYSGQNALNSQYGALYTPWISVFDPRNGKGISVPPSGAVAGRYAAVDQSRGVHKAAAGVDDGRLLSVLDVDKLFNDADQAKMNPLGINVIRDFTGVGTVLWGARTTSSDPEWTYLNVRRFFLFVEQSVKAATKWAVFEPNAPALWKAITLSVTGFLRTQWIAGALVGLKEDDAFYVKCDAETNPPDSVDLGRVITEVGLAVVRPAEFVILRFSQKSL